MRMQAEEEDEASEKHESDVSQLHSCLPVGRDEESQIQGIRGNQREEAVTDSALSSPSSDLLTRADLEDFLRSCTVHVQERETGR